MKIKLLPTLVLFVMLTCCASNKPYDTIDGSIAVEKIDVKTMAKAMKIAAIKHGWKVVPPDDKDDLINLKLEHKKAVLELEVSILNDYYQYKCISQKKVKKKLYSKWIANLEKEAHSNIAEKTR
jgi:hypothetical protein